MTAREAVLIAALREAQWLFAQIAQLHSADSGWLESAMEAAKKGYALTKAALGEQVA